MAWVVGWGVLLWAQAWAAPGWLALTWAWLPSAVLAAATAGSWRRVIVLAGLPLALALSGGMGDLPDGLWLAAALGVLAVYPLSAWRDAPLFPTSRRAIMGIGSQLGLPIGARILDAGSGLGHGLRALRAAFPGARVEGVERSALLVCLGRLWPATPPARRGDMWRHDWADFDVVYLFQSPETMSRAWAKACAEMREGAWLLSLEFEVPGLQPDGLTTVSPAGSRRVLAYRIPRRAAPHPTGGPSDPRVA